MFFIRLKLIMTLSLEHLVGISIQPRVSQSLVESKPKINNRK